MVNITDTIKRLEEHTQYLIKAEPEFGAAPTLNLGARTHNVEKDNLFKVVSVSQSHASDIQRRHNIPNEHTVISYDGENGRVYTLDPNLRTSIFYF